MFVLPTPSKSNSTSSRKQASDKLKDTNSIHANQTFFDILESIVPSTEEGTRELNELWKDLPDIEKALIANPNHKNLRECNKVSVLLLPSKGNKFFFNFF